MEDKGGTRRTRQRAAAETLQRMLRMPRCA